MNLKENTKDLITYLQNEAHITNILPTDVDHAFNMYRDLVNVRNPNLLPEKYLNIQDEFLKEYNHDIVNFNDLSPIKNNSQLYVFQGDITTLKIDGIVNAANSDLLGCFIKGHHCIDNIIHTKAGVQLRYECSKIMEAQGRKDAVGRAKITDAYNLPSKYVIHTVGPYVKNKQASNMQKDLLKKCYTSVLKLADENNLESLAFCSISTGVFGFPKEEAAIIATDAVKQYLEDTHSTINVVFNVFSNEDYEIYNRILN